MEESKDVQGVRPMRSESVVEGVVDESKEGGEVRNRSVEDLTQVEDINTRLLSVELEVQKSVLGSCGDQTEDDGETEGNDFEERDGSTTLMHIEDEIEHKDTGDYEEDFQSELSTIDTGTGDFSETEESECGNVGEHSFLDFSPWDSEENTNRFFLWQNNKEFWCNGSKYATAAITYGNECVDTCYRAHSRKPTVKEFWNYYLSKMVPRQSWYAEWKIVNTERRGWPMQYKVKAKLLVKSVIYRSPLAPPKTEIEVVKSYDERYKVGQEVEVAVWQLEPCESGPEFFEEGRTIEEGKAALALARKFFEEYYFPCDTGDFVAYFENCFYERLELIHYLEHVSPTQGTLSNKDRVKIISGIKYYHNLSNVLQDLMNDQVDDDEEEGEDAVHRQESDSKYLTLQMQLDRHKVELRFLLDKTMRALMGAISGSSVAVDEDSTVSSYDYVLVMKSLKPGDLLIVHEILTSCLGDKANENIRVMNDLEEAVRKCNAYSTIFVMSGEYSISGLGRLSAGGAIVGIPVNDVDVTITPTDDVGDVWITVGTDESGVSLNLNNLNFTVDEDCEKSLESVIHVTFGKLTMKDCSVRLHRRLQSTEEEGEKSKLIAVRVSDGASFSQENCKFDGLI
ncbi:unnamed protein product [Orchesella dallaii]|uniref:SHC SH2 domain-containing protein n=1 Tax=Orchesella dallaii TaxID=48710 RepID=A0ABP1PV36_9HEXA